MRLGSRARTLQFVCFRAKRSRYSLGSKKEPSHELRGRIRAANPEEHLKAYRRMAALGKKAWMKHGAVDYKECAGDDLAAKWGTPFTRVMKLRPGETAVFAYIVFKSRAIATASMPK